MDSKKQPPLIGLVLWLALTFFASNCVFAEDIILIANESVSLTILTREEIKNIFLSESLTYEDGQEIVIVVNKSPDIFDMFTRKYLQRNWKQFTRYYRNKLFSGSGTIPRGFKSEKQVVSYVSKTKGAISYISTPTPTANVKVIEINGQ